MLKPNNYDNTQSFGGFTPIELGGHVCIIKKVEEITSKTGKEMIKISLDTDRTDSQPNYYTNSWNNDTRENKKWGCVVYQLVYDAKGNTSRGFKTFIEMVEKSNQGFNVDAIWGDNFANFFTNKLVGGVFGREEYLDKYGESKFAIKCTGFRTVQDVRDGKVEPPKDKLLSPSSNNDVSNGSTDFEPAFDGDMPF